MIERLSELSRRVIFFARYEASQFGSRAIETHHLLLGLFRESWFLFEPYLKTHQEMDWIREELAKAFPIQEKESPSVDLPFNDETQHAMDVAIEEADARSHGAVQPLHIVIGLLSVPECAAAGILRRYGMEVESMRKAAAEKPQFRLRAFPGLGSRSELRLGAESVLSRIADERLGAAHQVLTALVRNRVITIDVTTPDGKFSISFGHKHEVAD